MIFDAGKTKKIFIHILLPLIVGVLIYILFRKPVTYFHHWFNQKNVLINTGANFFTGFLKFQLPDMLWAYSFTSCLTIFWQQPKKVTAAFAIIFVSLYECLPLLFLRGEYFDWKDIFFMIIAVLLSLLTVRL